MKPTKWTAETTACLQRYCEERGWHVSKELGKCDLVLWRRNDGFQWESMGVEIQSEVVHIDENLIRDFSILGLGKVLVICRDEVREKILEKISRNFPEHEIQRVTVCTLEEVGSSRVDLQACKLEYSIVSPK